jgi:hypothetical protein
MQTDISRVAKLWLIMMWLIVLSPIIVILYVAVTDRGGGLAVVFYNLAVVFYVLGCFIAIPLILIGIALICARQLSKSRFALLYYPVIGGLVAAACVPHLIHANLSAKQYLTYGIAYGLGGLVIGVLTFILKAGVAQHRKIDRPTSDLKEKP